MSKPPTPKSDVFSSPETKACVSAASAFAANVNPAENKGFGEALAVALDSCGLGCSADGVHSSRKRLCCALVAVCSMAVFLLVCAWQLFLAESVDCHASQSVFCLSIASRASILREKRPVQRAVLRRFLSKSSLRKPSKTPQKPLVFRRNSFSERNTKADSRSVGCAFFPEECEAWPLENWANAEGLA